MKGLKRMAVILLTIGVVLYVALCGFVYSIQRSLVFPAPAQVHETTSEFEILKTPEGTALMASRSLRNAKTIVYFHGNGEQVSDVCDIGQLFVKAGYQFVAVEYPGYPLMKEQQPSEAGLYAAAESGLKHLEKTVGLERTNIVLLGQSLGSGVAVEMAKRSWSTSLVLLTPYTRLPDVAAAQFWFLPVNLLMKDTFDSLSKTAEVSGRSLVIHGTDDEVINISLGKKLQSQLPNSEFVEIAGGRHNGLWLRPETFAAVVKFIGPPSPPPADPRARELEEAQQRAASDTKMVLAVEQQLKAIAAYEKDCGAVMETEFINDNMEEALGDECTSINFEQSCAPDNYGCLTPYETCRTACGTSCATCQGRCTQTCSSCKTTCASSSNPKNCVTECAVARNDCRQACTAQREDPCFATCLKNMQACNDAGDAKKKKLCPDCQALMSCLFPENPSAPLPKDRAAECLKKLPGHAAECVEWCYEP